MSFCSLAPIPRPTGCGLAAFELDAKGFVLTGSQTGVGDCATTATRRPPPLPFKSNVPGVFAVGDARSGSVKRVGGAIGEGAAVVVQLHSYLDASKNLANSPRF